MSGLAKPSSCWRRTSANFDDPERKRTRRCGKDVMTLNVISVSEDSPIREVVRLLLRYRISAVPVVDRARKVVGIISESDLLRPEELCASSSANWSWLGCGGSFRSLEQHPFVRSEMTIPSSRPAFRQSAAHSGSQGCRPRTRRHRRSRRAASLTERARC